MTTAYDLWLDEHIDDFDEEITELLDKPDVEVENYALWSDQAADEREDRYRRKWDGE